MNVAITAALIGVGGIIVGVILSAVINWIAGRRKEGQQGRDIRRVLRWENEYNRNILSAFWRKVTLEPSPEGGTEQQDFEKRLRLVTLFLPSFGHQMWQSEASVLAAVLTSEEFARSYEFHNDVGTFASQRAALASDMATIGATARKAHEYWKEKKDPSAYTSNERDMLSAFNSCTKQIWDDCERICNTWARANNPVSDDKRRLRILQGIGEWFGRMPKPTVSWRKPQHNPGPE